MQKVLTFFGQVSRLCLPAAWLHWCCSEEMSLIAPLGPLPKKRRKHRNWGYTRSYTAHPVSGCWGALIRFTHSSHCVFSAAGTPLSVLLLLIQFTPLLRSWKSWDKCKAVAYYPFHRTGSDGFGMLSGSCFSPFFLKLFFPVGREMHRSHQIYDAWPSFLVIKWWACAWKTCWLNRQFP